MIVRTCEPEENRTKKTNGKSMHVNCMMCASVYVGVSPQANVTDIVKGIMLCGPSGYICVATALLPW